MPHSPTSVASNGALTVRAFRGAQSVLLAMDLDASMTKDFAGFSISYRRPGKPAQILLNRLNFQTPIHSETDPSEREWTPSNLAPFQKFRWSHFPQEDDTIGEISYEVTAMYFSSDTELKAGPSAQVTIDLSDDPYANFQVGFTKGYLSSQAYAQRFQNKPFRPPVKSIDFDTKPFVDQYNWLGSRARELVFDFLDECLNSPDVTVDLFAYDLDEPDFVRGLQKLGKRLRAVLDDAPLHTKDGALEIDAKNLLLASAGADQVKIGHFKRFSHDKVMILKRGGQAVKVLTGSANFSLRGLYVQANNVIVIQDAAVAGAYAQAFETSFTQMKDFDDSPVASKWFDFTSAQMPPFSVAFSPHKTANVSLDAVSKAIEGATRSVLFAVMELGGSGDVMAALQNLPNRKGIFSYGVTQNDTGLNLFKPGVTNGEFAAFSYLKDKVPANFREEWNGGVGQVIHNKFVVVDFDGPNPVVFTGSSNLAAGGEISNGDNLLAIRDRTIATLYAVEAIRLVDHYQFRYSMKNATSAKPLTLAPRSVPWWASSYDPANVKYLERQMFSGGSV